LFENSKMYGLFEQREDSACSNAQRLALNRIIMKTNRDEIQVRIRAPSKVTVKKSRPQQRSLPRSQPCTQSHSESSSSKSPSSSSPSSSSSRCESLPPLVSLVLATAEVGIVYDAVTFVLSPLFRPSTSIFPPDNLTAEARLRFKSKFRDRADLAQCIISPAHPRASNPARDVAQHALRLTQRWCLPICNGMNCSD
jgi:hypothetical protein